MAKSKKSSRPLLTIGWREWVSLPQLGIDQIKAKVDTGARSSALHAIHVKEFKRDGQSWVKFQVHPQQRSSKIVTTTEAQIIDRRSIRSSSGKAAVRPVILTMVYLLGIQFEVELTLANRDEMGFRMLLGREALRNRFLVDSGKSYLGGRPRGTKIHPSTKTEKK